MSDVTGGQACFSFFMLPGDGRRRRRRHSVVNCGCCPAWAAGRLPGAGQRVRGRPFYYGILFFFLVWRLLPGAGGRSPARRGAWGERGGCPSTPPAPPYSPFCGNAKAVPLAGLYLVRRVSRGHRREPSRPFRPGDVRACCGAPSALRASGIAFAPAPSLQQLRGWRG